MSRPFRPRRLSVEWWLVSLLSTAIVLFLVWDHTTDRLDKLAYDVALQLDRRAPDPRILVVAIDSRSLQEVGAWPWPRDVQARLIEAVGRGRPRAIAYDVLLLENGAGDDKLGQAMAGAGAPVFAPVLLDAPGRDGAPFDVVAPIAPVRAAIKGMGHVNLIADADGLVRRVRLVEDDGRRSWPHLMELMHRAVGGAASTPSKDAAPALIPFVGPGGRFPTIDAASVLRGELPTELLKDRLVIIGATAQGLGDQHATPLGDRGRAMSGSEILANVLDGLISKRMIGEAGLPFQLALALVPLWAMLAALRLLRPREILLATATLVALILAITAAALLGFRLWAPPATALVGLALVYPLWGWRSLAAVNGYMIGELEQFRAEPDALARPAQNPVLDPVLRQTVLLNEAIVHMRDMRRFVSDSLDQLPDAVLVVDAEGRIQLANREADRLLAPLRASGQAGDDVSLLLGRLQPVGAPEQAVWPPAVATAGRTASAPDGRHFKLQITPRLSADGGSLGWIVQMSDITAIWTAERQREEILRFLTHDMRSPQASILAVIETAEPAELSPAVGRRIENYARRTLDLADGFVHLARAEALQYRMQEVDLSDVLLDAADDLWPQSSAKGVKVAVVHQDLSLLVMGERSLLTRALINLIGNAIKYSPSGSRLTCTLSISEVEGRWMAFCSVADQGPGVPAEHLANLFEQFQRAASSATVRIGGVGLGLAFVHTVAVRHGGRVWCDSPPGRGATFTLALPLIETVPD